MINVVTGYALRSLVPLEIFKWNERTRILSLITNSDDFNGTIRISGRYHVIDFVMRIYGINDNYWRYSPNADSTPAEYRDIVLQIFYRKDELATVSTLDEKPVIISIMGTNYRRVGGGVKIPTT